MSKSVSPPNNLEESDNAGRGCRQESSVEWLVTLKCLQCLQSLIFFFNCLWRRHHIQTWMNIAIYAFVTSHVGECFNQKSITDDHFLPWLCLFLSLCHGVLMSLCLYVFVSLYLGVTLSFYLDVLAPLCAF